MLQPVPSPTRSDRSFGSGRRDHPQKKYIPPLGPGESWRNIFNRVNGASQAQAPRHITGSRVNFKALFIRLAVVTIIGLGVLLASFRV